MPGAVAQHRHPTAPASRYLCHLLGHEGEGSLLALLKAELPHYFGNLNVAHLRLQWVPTSAGATGTNRSMHPFLRSQLLADDYSVYDAERARLFRRAAKAGIPVANAGASLEDE